MDITRLIKKYAQMVGMSTLESLADKVKANLDKCAPKEEAALLADKLTAKPPMVGADAFSKRQALIRLLDICNDMDLKTEIQSAIKSLESSVPSQTAPKKISDTDIAKNNLKEIKTLVNGLYFGTDSNEVFVKIAKLFNALKASLEKPIDEALKADIKKEFQFITNIPEHIKPQGEKEVVDFLNLKADALKLI